MHLSKLLRTLIGENTRFDLTPQRHQQHTNVNCNAITKSVITQVRVGLGS